MRFLADESFPGNSLRLRLRLRLRLLQQRGVDVVRLPVSEQGSPDEWVLQTAATQARTILTFDHDFGALVYQQGELLPAAGIVFFRAKPSRLPSRPFGYCG